MFSTTGVPGMLFGVCQAPFRPTPEVVSAFASPWRELSISVQALRRITISNFWIDEDKFSNQLLWRAYDTYPTSRSGVACKACAADMCGTASASSMYPMTGAAAARMAGLGERHHHWCKYPPHGCGLNRHTNGKTLKNSLMICVMVSQLVQLSQGETARRKCEQHTAPTRIFFSCARGSRTFGLFQSVRFLKVIPSHPCFVARCLLHFFFRTILCSISYTCTQPENHCHAAGRVGLWPRGRTVASHWL